MKTTQEWLSEVKNDPSKMQHWLERQYVGEALAAQRIQALADAQSGNRAHKILCKIVSDEMVHCSWVADLLTARGIELPKPTYDADRYWKPVLTTVENFDDMAAAGHLAEAMRLVRIRAIVADQEIDQDIREVFQKILPDEEFHTVAFAALTTREAVERMRDKHEAGLQALGLEI